MSHPNAGARAALPALAPASALLAGLTPEQTQAVEHGPGPLLLIAGPGAGKTKTLTHRVAHLLATGRARPQEILAVTFSVRAAGELRLRLADLLGEHRARGVTAATFHSVCARILREHADVFGRTDAYTVYDQADVRRVIDWLLSDAQRGHIQHALQTCGQPAAGEVLTEISLAKSRLLTPDVYETMGGHPAAALIAAVWREVELELRRSNAWDFDDLLASTVQLLAEHPHRLAYYRQRWPWILVDEFQDTNEAQAVLVTLLAGATGNIACVGDDDQCLPRGTQVTMADGSRRSIEQIRPGDRVLSNRGAGQVGPARVMRVHRTRRRRGIAIRLASGRELVSTPDHTHFAGFVAREISTRFAVYLMFKRGVGFRIGSAVGAYRVNGRDRLGAAQRCLHERADAVWIISVHDEQLEARIAEVRLAATYGLPLTPFRAQHDRARYGEGSVSASQTAIDRLYASLETAGAAQRLFASEGLSVEHPHHRAQTHTGRAGVENIRRRFVTVTLCADCRGLRPLHRVSARGTDASGRAALERLGLRCSESNRARGGWVFDVHRADYSDALRVAEQVADALGAELRPMARLAGPQGTRHQAKSLPFCPARLVRPGMVMVNDGGEFDRVGAVDHVGLDVPVYDLDVEHSHNYIADGVLTHNCIYSWRGAEHSNLLAFADRFPGHHTIVLGRNFRSRAEIVERAATCVAHNQARTPKALIAMRGPGGHVTTTGFATDHQEGEWIAGAIVDALADGVEPWEVLIVARTGFATGPVQHALARAGIPHRVLGSLGLYERSEVRDALAYLALLANPADAQAFRRAISAPRRGVGTATTNRIVAYARHTYGGDLLTACAHSNHLDGMRPSTLDRVVRFGHGLGHVRAELTSGRSLGHAVVASVMLDGGLVRHFQQRRDQSPKAEERRDAERVLEDLRSMCRAAQAFEEEHPTSTVTGFLEHAAGLHAHALAPGDEDRRITVSTIHRAKGTEAKLVVLAGCEEQLLPSWRALADPDPGPLEEERRLFYVACTRAKDRLEITHAAARNHRPTGGPSRFLTEAGLTSSAQPLAA